MVDPANRAQFAEGLRHLVSGTITNDQFEDWHYQNSKDPAIAEIFILATWPLYSDLKEHRLRGEHALTEGMKLDLARCILFLRTDLEYEWPKKVGFKATLRAYFGNPWRNCGGDNTVWPFFRREDYREAKAGRPPFLDGPKNKPVDGESNFRVGPQQTL